MAELLCKSTNFCAGCGISLALRMLSQAVPKDVIVSMATGCSEVTTTVYPDTSWNVPWIHAAFETAASVASGIEAAVKKLGKQWKVLAIAGDGGTYDIGLQSLSGMLERGHKVTFVCVDNECYANCLSLSTSVMTKNGLKRITDIGIGDEVYAFDMKMHTPVLKKCTGVFDNGVKDIYDIGTMHHVIRATGNHPFLAVKKNGRGRENELVWKTLDELNVGDQVVVLKKLDIGISYSFNFKPSKKGDYKVNKIHEVSIPEKSSQELMEYLGMFVGDGWCRPEKSETGFALPVGSEERGRLKVLHKKLFGVEMNREDDYYVYINSANIAKFICSLGFGKGAKNKTIPDWIFTLPRQEKEAFVLGLVSTDGNIVEETSIRFTSSSHELLKRFRLLLQTMEYRVGKIHWRKTPKGTFVVYRKLLKDTENGYICFSRRREWNIKKYTSQYKYNNFLIGNEYFETEKVKYKKMMGKEPTLDLRVEGEHNFIADGIVVHNTGAQRSGSTPYSAWTTTSPAGRAVSGKQQPKKPIAEIVASHKVPYVATASVAYPSDLVEKAKKAFEKQPSFLLIHCPCPPSWKTDTPKTMEVAKLAVETGMWVLYEIEDQQLRISKRFEQFKPVESYLQLQGRFKHLAPEAVKVIEGNIKSEWDRLEKIEKCGTRY